MKIDNIFMPSAGPSKTPEESIVVLGAYPLLAEIRDVIFKTKVFVNPQKTIKKSKDHKKGVTGNLGLTPRINKFLGHGFSHYGWAPHYSDGALNKNKKIDWYKTTPDPYWSKKNGVGVGLETQFGNNFQAHGDLQRLQSAYNTFEIGAGIIIVPSDELSEYLADRCANYSNTVSKLEQQIDTMLGARAFNICPIGIISVCHDGLSDTGAPHLSSPWVNEDVDVDTSDPD